jgi:hypothetical protein
MKTLFEIVDHMFSYDPNSGIIAWKNCYHKEKNGKEAGWTNDQGYRCIAISNKKFRGHRLAWLIKTGEEVPNDMEIDHIDGNRLNNRWSNLRIATKKQNALNKALRSDNKLGVKGVKYNQKRKKYEAWIRINGKPKRIGYYSTLDEASNAFREADKERSGEWQSCRY